MGKTDRKVVVENLCHLKINGQLELSVELTAPHLDWDKEIFWFRFPAPFLPYLTDRYDPFLAALLPLAMKTKSRLILQGSVSERLMANSNQFMKIISNWYEILSPINIEANNPRKARRNSKAVGSFFTGGVDSFYTVLKNLGLYNDESRITHLLYVHGFDVDINNKKLFSRVKNEIETAATDLGLEIIFIKTNLRQITNGSVRWGEEQHGAALASAALCLQKLFKIMYMPSSVAYSELYEWGSHPFLDPLWSTEQMQFIHDGNEANRSPKILWELSNSKVALTHLRVCWRNPDNNYNCGVCGKCIRTKINLKIAGKLDQCKTLDNNLDKEQYKNLLLKSAVERRNLAENIQLAGDTNPELKRMLLSVQNSVSKKQNKLGYKLKKLVSKYF